MTGDIHVTVRLGEPLRRAAGQFRFALTLPAGATLADLVSQLAETYPDFARRYAGTDLGHAHPYRLFVNFHLVAADQAAGRALADGDTVHILIPIAGGAVAGAAGGAVAGAAGG